MKKSIRILIAMAVIIGGAALFLVMSGYEFGKSYHVTINSSGIHLVEDGIVSNDSSGDYVDDIDVQLDDFSGMDIQVDMGKLQLVPSDSNRLVVNNKGRKELKTSYSIDNGIFKLNQKNVEHFSFSLGKASPEIILYYKSDKSYNDVKLRADSGNILVSKLKCDKLNAAADSGNVNVEKTECTSGQVECDSGNITVDSFTANTIKFKADSGNVTVNNLVSNSKLDIDTDSGNSVVSGELKGSTEIKADSGNITIEAKGSEKDYSYNAKVDVGKISVNGNKSDNKMSGGSGSNKLDLECDSGNIDINFKE